MPFPKTILMIEDDGPTREVVRMACVGQNLTLIEADSGEKGMEMIEKSEPDLVILDLNLPGVSGMDVCRQLRADGQERHDRRRRRTRGGGRRLPDQAV
jgi:DNA-binding response OmpR family regulator